MLNLERLKSLRVLAFVALVAIGVTAGDRPALAITSDEHLERAQGYFEKGELDSSIIELKNALQRNRKNAEARLLLGRVYIRKGRGADAEKELQRTHDLGVRIDNFKELMGQARLLQGNFDDVLQSITVEQSDAPARKAALFALRGEAQLGLGNSDDAKQSFTTAVTHNPGNANAHTGLGKIAMAKGLLDVADAELAKAVAADPTALGVLRLKGDLLFAHTQLPEAERAYEELVATYPFVPHVLRLSYVRSALGKNEEAIKDVERVLKVAPQHAGANHLRALAAYRTQDYKTAKFHIDQALTYFPLHPQFQLLAGATNYALGQNEQALRYFERYIAREPSDDRARRMMGATLLRLGNAEAAREVLKPLEAKQSADSADDAQLLSLIGTAAIRSGDLESGRSYLEQLVEMQPDNAKARAQLGVVQVALGEAEEGISDLEKSLEQDPELDSALISLIVTYLRERQFDRALEVARRLQESSPDNAQAHTLVGISQAGLGDIDGATQTFEQALKINPGDPTAAVNLASIKTAQGKMDEAYNLYNQVLEQNPDHLGAMLRLARLEKQRDRRTEELAVLERAFDRHPGSLPTRLALGRALIERRAPQRALEVTAGLQDEAPNNAAVLEVVGQAMLRVGNTEEAINTFRKLVEARPDNAVSHFNLARAFEAADNFDKADIELQKALLLDPAHTQAKFARARILVRRGGLEVAKSLVEDLKSAFPDEPAILDLEARIALGQNRPEEAVRLLQHALETSNDSDLVILLAQAQARSGTIDAGMASLGDWLVRFPDDIRVRTYLAQSNLSLKRFETAKSEYQTILASAPDNIAALNNLAWINWRSGSPQAGLVHARRALELAPENPGIMDTLAIIQLDLGDSAEALDLLRRAHAQLPQSAEIQLHLARALIDEGETDEAKDLLTRLVDSEHVTAERAEAEVLLRRLP